ncbi:MAG: hypothetical protein ACR2NU_13365 [Aeoliella sp.]
MWHFDGETATHVQSQLSLSVAPNSTSNRNIHLCDSAGLLLTSLWHSPILDRLDLVEVYLRDDDLVARYASCESFPFDTEFYWNLRSLGAEAAPVVAVSLLISVRTNLLDTHPEIEVCTTVPQSSLTQADSSDGQMFLGTLTDELKLIEFAPAEDCATVSLDDSQHDNQVIHRRLFSHFLEKGVIRRARLFAAIAPANITEQQAEAICQDFLKAELPLTT